MLKILLPLAGLALLARAPSPWRVVEPLAPDRAVETLFPESTLLYVEGAGLSVLLGEGAAHPAVARVLSSPIGAALGGEAALEAALEPVDRALGGDALATLASLSSRGVALGATPRGKKPAFALAMLGDDPARTGAILQAALDLAAEKAGFPRAFEKPSEHTLGAQVWYVGDELVVARRDALIVAGNEGGYVRDVLALAANADGAGLAGTSGFRDAHDARPRRALLWAWADVEGLRALPFGNGKKLAALAEVPAKPEVQLLLGTGVAAFPTARTVTASLELDADRFAFSLRGDGTDEMRLLRERAGQEGAPLPAPTTDDVATAVLHRDLAAVFEHRAKLFPADVLPRLAKPMSELAVLFGGRDLSEDILPHVGPWITLVARDVAFDEGAVPEIRLPALAGMFRLEGEEVGPRLTAAFQSLVAISNIERAQQAKEPLLLSLVHEGPVSVTRAAFLAPRQGEGVDMAYNLEPACAQVGDVFVLGTHEALVRGLVRQLLDGDVRRSPGGAERVVLDAAAIARGIADNREALVMGTVLEEGKTYEEAEGDIDGLHALVELFSRGRIELEQVEDEIAFSVELSFDDHDRERMR